MRGTVRSRPPRARRAARAAGETALWWAVLTGLWLVLIQTVDRLELLVGTAAALPVACAARAARLAAAHR